MAKSPPTPTEFGAETEEALLGEAWHRKNWGRSEQIQRSEVAILVDCAGNDELAAGIQIACEVVPVLSTTAAGEIPEGTSQTPPIVGLLEWGNDGSTVTAEFDFVNGTVISVAAASVRVKARFEVPPAEPFPVIVRAHVGYFPKPAGPAQRTLGGLIAGGNDLALPIPKFARRVRVVRSGALESARITLLSVVPLGAVAEYGPTLDPVIELPIPNDARVLAISNLGADPHQFRAIFDLWI